MLLLCSTLHDINLKCNLGSVFPARQQAVRQWKLPLSTALSLVVTQCLEHSTFQLSLAASLLPSLLSSPDSPYVCSHPVIQSFRSGCQACSALSGQEPRAAAFRLSPLTQSVD